MRLTPEQFNICYKRPALRGFHFERAELIGKAFDDNLRVAFPPISAQLSSA
jgi:hypothetical protein